MYSKKGNKEVRKIFKDAQYKKNLLKKLNEAIHKCNSKYNIICVKNIIKKWRTKNSYLKTDFV